MGGRRRQTLTPDMQKGPVFTFVSLFFFFFFFCEATRAGTSLFFFFFLDAKSSGYVPI